MTYPSIDQSLLELINEEYPEIEKAREIIEQMVIDNQQMVEREKEI